MEGRLKEKYSIYAYNCIVYPELQDHKQNSLVTIGKTLVWTKNNKIT